MREPSPAPRLRAVASGATSLTRRPTRWLELGSTLWTAAEALYLVGLLVVAYRAGGVGAVALVTLVQALPSVVLPPLIMGASDRIRRTTLLRVVLVTRVGTVAAATVVIATDGPILAIYLLAGIDGVASTLLRPIRAVLVPMIARAPDELVSANVAITTGASAAGLAGPALAAALLATAGVGPVFAAGTAVLGFALVAVARIQAADVRRRDPPATASTNASTDRTGFGRSWPVLATIVGQRFVRGMLSVLVAATALELLDAGDEAVGILNAAIGLGGLAGSFLSIGLIGRRNLAAPFLAAVGLFGTALAAPAVVPMFVPAIAFLVVSGAGKSILEVAGSSLVQRTVPAASRGRVLSVLESMVTVALAAGAVVASVLVEQVGAATALLAAGAVSIGLSALAWRAVRAADVAAAVPEAEIALLRRVPFFRPLQLDVIESLAGAVGRQMAPPGAVIVRQGDPGDRFFIVESGKIEALVDGERTRELGPGDSFGEIALLRSVPRTATIRAVEATTLVTLARDDFLDAVSAHHESAVLAEGVVRARLGA